MARRPSSEVNLTSIAQNLNVSVSTVSRALRKADGVHEDTRRRVVEAANSLGYNLQWKGGASVTRRPTSILALAQCSVASSDQRYLAGMSRASVSLNLSILSHHITTDQCGMLLDPDQQPPALRAGHVEGIVLIHRWPADIARELSRRWPLVSIVHQYPESPVDHVGIDDRPGIYTIMRHLYDAGHRRIGFFGLAKEMSWACSRFAAYVEALTLLGLEYDPARVVEISLEQALSPSNFEMAGSGERVLALIKKGVDAWVCSSSIVGYTLCRNLLDAGIKIPKDVSIAGYHENPAAPSDLPLMTSTRISDEELGAAALRRLIHRMDHPNEDHRSILLPARLVVGETTRPVKSKRSS